MQNESAIDVLLREDEAALKAKRKRLKAFETALEDARRAITLTSTSAAALTNAGDLSRAEIARVFELSKAEQSALLPPRQALAAGARDEAAEAEDDSAAAPNE